MGSKGKNKQDNEIKGQGNSVNYKFRMHDARIGRFFAVDPLAYNFPWNSPYAFSENRVIDGIEFEGLEVVYFGCCNNSKRVNFTLMTGKEIQKKLDEYYSAHQGHLRVFDIKGYSKASFWRVYSPTNTYARSVSTKYIQYENEEAFKQNKWKTKQTKKDISQWLYSHEIDEDDAPFQSADMGLSGEVKVESNGKEAFVKGSIESKDVGLENLILKSNGSSGVRANSSSIGKPLSIKVSGKAYVNFNIRDKSSGSKFKFTMPVGIGGIQLTFDSKGLQSIQFSIGTSKKKAPSIKIEKTIIKT